MRKFKYNKEFWDLMEGLNTETATRINRILWNFVRGLNLRIVLDYGAGLDLLRKFAPRDVTVDSYDIGEYPIEYTGIVHDSYDLVFLCDVLEHVPDFQVLDDIFSKTEYILATVPILPLGKKMKDWKHFKYETGEHLHYFTERSLDLFFEARGFALVKSGYPEVECGIREDIYTALYKKEKGD